MMSSSEDMERLISWFGNAGGHIDSSIMGFADFPADGGRGAVALQDIEEGQVLFTIPRSLTLSIRTSTLPKLLGATWDKYQLGQGWAGLILCCLWEESRGSASRWSGYLETLPTQFDTPMFWSEVEIAELAGTAVVDKIGKTQAEEDYMTKVVPTVKAHPEIFGANDVDQHFSAAAYHRAGSRILSRSFTVQKWRGPAREVPITGDEDTHEAPDPDASQGSIGDAGMEVDEDAGQAALVADVQQDTTEDDSDEENEDDPSDVALVPIADMLNARHGSENAKLFYEANVLKMITTKRITRGEQIWNTYGDPPNSDLLRRYGHVDILSLETLNPADIAELPADKLVNALPEGARAGAMDRVEFWLDEGGDDVFILETDDVLPEALLSFVRLLNLTTLEYTKAREKSKLPKGKSLDVAGATTVCTALRARLSEYTTTLEVDEALLRSDSFSSLPRRQQHAIVVRVGEKRILHTALRYTVAIAQPSRGPGEAKTGGKAKKRKNPNDESGPSSLSSKKARS